MARKKALKLAELDDSSIELLKKIKKFVAEAGNSELQQDYDPVVQLAVFAAKHDPAAEFPEDAQIIKLRLDAAKEVAKYIHPQKRSQEVVGKGGGPIQIQFAGYTKEDK